MPERRARRIIPSRPVLVEIATTKVASRSGIVANISEWGACVWTDDVLAAGDVVVLKLDFAEAEQPYCVAGYVVWSERPEDSAGRCRYGMHWPNLSHLSAKLLKSLLTGC